MAKYCSSCGKEISEGIKFCPSCGKAVLTETLSKIQPQTQAQIKNPGIAAVLSFFITGAGKIYNGQIGKGILAFISVTISMISLIMGNLISIAFLIFLWIMWIYDAYSEAQKINRGEIKV